MFMISIQYDCVIIPAFKKYYYTLMILDTHLYEYVYNINIFIKTN